jgi:hypothetical protein
MAGGVRGFQPIFGYVTVRRCITPLCGGELGVNLLMDFALWFGFACIYSNAGNAPLLDSVGNDNLGTLRVLTCCICFIFVLVYLLKAVSTTK